MLISPVPPLACFDHIEAAVGFEYIGVVTQPALETVTTTAADQYVITRQSDKAVVARVTH